MLDGDRQGQAERDRYMNEYGIPASRVTTTDEFVKGVGKIEDLLDEDARNAVRNEIGITSEPTKAHIRRFFQERLASDRITNLSPGFDAKAKELLEALEYRLQP